MRKLFLFLLLPALSSAQSTVRWVDITPHVHVVWNEEYYQQRMKVYQAQAGAFAASIAAQDARIEAHQRLEAALLELRNFSPAVFDAAMEKQGIRFNNEP